MNENEQKGQVLLLSLILMLVISMIGVSSVRTSNIELLMSNNFKDKQVAMLNAQVALLEIEGWINSNTFTVRDFNSNTCNKAVCFKDSCENGLCLSSFVDQYGRCHKSNQSLLIEGATLILKKEAVELDVFSDARFFKEIKHEGISNPTKYIVEFDCYSNRKKDSNNNADYKNTQNWAVNYKITLQSFGVNNQTQILLQVNYTQG